DPTNPGSAVYENTNSLSNDVFVSGDFAFVADDISGLAIIDISDPTNPGSPVYENTEHAFGVYVVGDYAYIADAGWGLVVIDISDPTDPVTVATEDTTSISTDIYVDGNFAYLAAGASGLAIIDVSDPTNPGLPVYSDTVGDALDVHVDGNFAYIADGGQGFSVVDISDPTSPVTLSNLYTSGFTHGLFMEGDFAFVAAHNSGLAVIQVRERVDLSKPLLSEPPTDLIVEIDYTNQTISWNVTDLNPDTYIIYLFGTEVVSSTSWTSGVPVTYAIPDGFALGSYLYSAIFVDEEGNSMTDGVTFLVGDTVVPTITSSPVNISVENYSGLNLSWTATDFHPYLYTVELDGGVVAGPSVWTSGEAITYNIPDGLGVGTYTFAVIFYDDEFNSVTDEVIFTVETAVNPLIDSPADIFYEEGSTSNIITWNATDLHPDVYILYMDGVELASDAWSSGVALVVDIDGHAAGSYNYTIIVYDESGNFASDTVIVEVSAVVPELTHSINALLMIGVVVLGLIIRKGGKHKKK
ncbi:MAG: LVIVD repeat-containing protein, partial [Candidatus Kariarchaeaceae archaeon]